MAIAPNRSGAPALRANAERDATLAALLGAAAQSDRAAFERLYRETSPKLFAVALRILRNREWAAEVLQESYLSIWKHAADYQSSLSGPLTWMTSILRNRCLDQLRRPRRETNEGFDEIVAQIEGKETGPAERLELSADAKALGRCLKQLESKQRQAISLAFLQGLTHSELAQHLGEPLGTVKTWVRRGLDRLRMCLTE
jgi:RNA polymerase sigma-70 factor (ECF subfamily)